MQADNDALARAGEQLEEDRNELLAKLAAAEAARIQETKAVHQHESLSDRAKAQDAEIENLRSKLQQENRRRIESDQNAAVQKTRADGLDERLKSTATDLKTQVREAQEQASKAIEEAATLRGQAVAAMVEKTKLSERRACRLVGLSRSVLHYETKPNSDDEALSAWLVELAHERRRFGYADCMPWRSGKAFTPTTRECTDSIAKLAWRYGDAAMASWWNGNFKRNIDISVTLCILRKRFALDLGILGNRSGYPCLVQLAAIGKTVGLNLNARCLDSGLSWPWRVGCDAR